MKDHGKVIQRVYEEYTGPGGSVAPLVELQRWAEFKAVIREQYARMLRDTFVRGIRLVNESPTIEEVRKHVEDTDGYLPVYQVESLCAGHPLVERSRGLTLNQMFRAVHDVYGHLIPRNDTSVDGELKAYVAHARMFASAGHVMSLDVLAAETLGQVAAYVVEGKFADVQVPRTMSWDHERLAKYLGV